MKIFDNLAKAAVRFWNFIEEESYEFHKLSATHYTMCKFFGCVYIDPKER